MLTQIFVFGSNRQGRHGKGSALEAVKRHGAIRGQGEGLQGQSYAIPTREVRGGVFHNLSRGRIAYHVNVFLDFAEKHPEMQFNLVPIGCGNAGYSPAEIAPLFRRRTANVNLPLEFMKYLL